MKLHYKFVKRDESLLTKIGQNGLCKFSKSKVEHNNSQECKKAQHKSDAKQQQTVTTHSMGTVVKLKFIIPNLNQVQD